MSDDTKRKVMIIAVVSTGTSLLVILISLAVLMHRNRRYKRYLQLQVQQKFEEFEMKPTIFPYNQLQTATRDFHPDMKLGQGAYGAVYKAWELHRVGNLMDLVDSTMSLQDEEKQEVQRVINIALLSIQNVAEERPTMERVVSMLQGDSESEALVLKPGNEEYMDTMRLRADVGMSSTTGLATVNEDLEESASFMNSSRRGASWRSDDGFLFPTATLELSDVSCCLNSDADYMLRAYKLEQSAS
ncbi:hypothetical protein M758_UG308300 [Ceratodon purpureus]|nr:hypothetical protein M758_UG308300 [Ceratodon purpureus]